MLQARIPPGNHTVELHYWPVMFTVGLIVAGVCAVLLLTASAIAFARSTQIVRRHEHST